jgi:hypothetical protein
LARLSAPPDLVVCDSQVVDRMVAETPPGVRCTTFSILLARLKGDLPAMVRAARIIDDLRDGDRILIGEACTHHALEDDIGRKKIPRWLREKTGKTCTSTWWRGATGRRIWTGTGWRSTAARAC